MIRGLSAMRHSYSIFRFLFLMSVLLAMTACVWFRLLETKNQLADFDANFSVKVTDSFLLEFLHPVMYAEDLLELAEVEPTQRNTLADGEHWKEILYKLDNEGHREKHAQTIEFTQAYNPQHLLIAWGFSALFLQLAPAEFLEASLRSLGKGTIFQSRQQLIVAPEDIPKLQAALPTQDSIRKALGTPAEIRPDVDTTLWIYNYELDTPTPPVPENEKKRIALIKLYFDPKTRVLDKFSGRFMGLRLSINYKNFRPETAEDPTDK